MEIKRITEIFVETNRRLVVRQMESSEQIVCSDCAALMVTAEQISMDFGISRRAVYQHIESGKIHFAETETGVSFVCPNSVTEILTKNK